MTTSVGSEHPTIEDKLLFTPEITNSSNNNHGVVIVSQQQDNNSDGIRSDSPSGITLCGGDYCNTTEILDALCTRNQINNNNATSIVHKNTHNSSSPMVNTTTTPPVSPVYQKRGRFLVWPVVVQQHISNDSSSHSSVPGTDDVETINAVY